MGRAVTPLSDAKIKRLKPREKLYRVSDGNGLVLEIKPNGTKVWRIRYMYEGKAKTYTIGEYPLVSLANARRETMEVRQKVLQGIDPVEERRAKERKKQIESKKLFSNIVQEFFQYKRHELVPNYYEKQKRRAEIYILPALGAKNIDDITKRDIVDTIKSVRHIKTPYYKKHRQRRCGEASFQSHQTDLPIRSPQ